MAKGDTLPKRCLDQYAFHSYGEDGRCTRCGVQREKQKAERAPSRGRVGLTRAQTQQTIILAINGAQGLALAFSPKTDDGIPVLAEDLLNQAEIKLLSDALTDEVEGSERLKKIVADLQKSSRHGKLILALVLIAAPRLARRGIIPAEAVPDLDQFTVSPPSGPTPSSDRGDWEREEHVGTISTPLKAVPGGSADENGRREVSNGSGDLEGSDSGEHEIRPVRTKAGGKE